MYTSVKY